MPPTVFPTGTTIYKPDKCWNGYTVYPTKTETGAVLIDMNGNVVKSWPQFPGNRIRERYFLCGTPGFGQLGGNLRGRPWGENKAWKACQEEIDGGCNQCSKCNSGMR